MEKESEIIIESEPAEKNRIWKILILILIILLLLAIIIILSWNVYDYIQAKRNETNVTNIADTNISNIPSVNGSGINITNSLKTSVCGDGKCNGTENYTNCARDCRRVIDDTCTPDCANKNCGDDSCGESCGTCTNAICNATGRCVPFVNCTADINCTAFTGNCGTGKCNITTKQCHSSFNVSTTVCRNNVSDCDSAELCSGSSATCGNDLNKSDGTSCSSGTCNNGKCVGGSVVMTGFNITQYNITWYFDKEYEYGTFVNGDYWIVGPVNITGISPIPDCAQARNGVMINPHFGTAQGYDSRAPYYNQNLCHQPSFIGQPGDSIISSISLPSLEDKRYLKSASLLTVVDRPQTTDSFRPPYTRPLRISSSGSDNLIFSFNTIHMEYLPSLPKVPNTPNINDSARKLQKLALEHGSNYESKGNGVNPLTNPYLYGRDIASYVSEMSLQLMLDYSNEEKKLTLVNLIQYGIDLYGIYLDGGYWYEDGGIFCGRKWPIIFAGIMLNNDAMKNIDQKFHEDQQTFYVPSSYISTFPITLNVWTQWLVPTTSGYAKVTNSNIIVEGINTKWMSSGILQGGSEGNVIDSEGRKYSCIKKHTVDDSNWLINKPGTGTNWQEYWVLNPNIQQVNPWKVNTSYTPGWFGIENDTEAYKYDGKAYEILRIIDDTHLEINNPYRGETNLNAPFKTGMYVYYGRGSPGKLRDFEEYIASHLGLPEWGIRHTNNPELDGLDWNAEYRRCCNANSWAGFLLMANALEEKTGSKTIWHDKAIFDFQDRYMEIETYLTGSPLWMKSWSGQFPINMWKDYRNNYGCTWTREDKTDDNSTAYFQNSDGSNNIEEFESIYSNGYYSCENSNVRCSWQASTTGQLVTSCSNYPNQRACNYDPCNLACNGNCGISGSVANIAIDKPSIKKIGFWHHILNIFTQ